MLYDIIKTFRGSPDGRFVEDYIAGTSAELTDSLAKVAIKEGWAREQRKPVEIDNKAVASDGFRRGRK